MRTRWIAEAITYKISSTILGLLILLVCTGKWRLSLTVTAIHFPIAIVWYLIHRKLWNNYKRRVLVSNTRLRKEERGKSGHQRAG